MIAPWRVQITKVKRGRRYRVCGRRVRASYVGRPGIYQVIGWYDVDTPHLSDLATYHNEATVRRRFLGP